MQSHTSSIFSFRIEVEPNSEPQTSAEIFDDIGKMFINIYPSASALTEIIAIDASPFIFAFFPVRSKRIAESTVTGKMIIMLSVTPTTAATAIAPNATWESPSPMNEKRLRTNVTPRSAEQSDISSTTISA